MSKRLDRIADDWDADDYEDEDPVMLRMDAITEALGEGAWEKPESDG